MAVKRDTKAWVVKIRNRSFLLDGYGYPRIFSSLAVAAAVARQNRELNGITAEPTRVRVRIEEIE